MECNDYGEWVAAQNCAERGLRCNLSAKQCGTFSTTGLPIACCVL